MKQSIKRKVNQVFKKCTVNLVVFGLALALAIVITTPNANIVIGGDFYTPMVNWNSGGG